MGAESEVKMSDRIETNKLDPSVDKRITDLEKRRLEIKAKIEALMAEFAEETGTVSLKKRKYDVGCAPNDIFDSRKL